MNLSLPLLRLWEDKYFLSFCLFFAICFYSLTSVAWSVFPGRDFGSYVGYFLGFFESDPPWKHLMTIRTFLSSFIIVIGASNIVLLNFLLFCSFVISLLLCYLIGLFISIGHARTFLLIMCFNLPLMIFYHDWSTDLILYIALVPYLAVVLLAARSRKTTHFVVLGVLTFCLVAIRPSNQLFLVVLLLPFLKSGVNRRSIRLAAMFFLAYTVPAVGYSIHNYVRFDTFAIARQGEAWAYRAFTQDKIIHRNNGPASESLAVAIEKHLLTKDAYKKFSISVEDFYASGNKRMFNDLVSLSDEIYGWDVNYKPIRDVALEGIWNNPGRFFQVSLMNLLYGYIGGYPPDQDIREYPIGSLDESNAARGLPSHQIQKNSEQESFDRRFENFRSYKHYTYSNTTAKDKPWNPEGRVFGQTSLAKPWLDGITFFPEESIRNGSSKLGYVIRLMADKFPPTVVFILCTLPIVFRLSEYRYRVLSLIFFAALLNSGLPMVFLNASIHYRVPYDFIFVFLGIVGLFSSDKLRRLACEVLPLKTNR